jgi:hypothetical protein
MSVFFFSAARTFRYSQDLQAKKYAPIASSLIAICVSENLILASSRSTTAGKAFCCFFFGSVSRSKLGSVPHWGPALRLDCSLQVVAILFKDLRVMYCSFFCEVENEFGFVLLVSWGGGEFSDDLGQVDGPSRFERSVHGAVIGQRATVIRLRMTVIGLASAVSAQASIWGWGWFFVFWAASHVFNTSCPVRNPISLGTWLTSSF